MISAKDIAEGIDEARDIIRVAIMATFALAEGHEWYAIKRALNHAIDLLDRVETDLNGNRVPE